MNLNEYIEKEKEDSNLFWRLSSGEHQNLLDEAIEKLESSGEAGVRYDREFVENEIQNLESDIIATAITYRDDCDVMVKELKETIELHKNCLLERVS